MINGKIIFDNHTKKFMTKKQMIKLAEIFWKQGIRNEEEKDIENYLKEECKKWSMDFKKEYLKMKIEHLFDQFRECMFDYQKQKVVTPFDVWDASNIETWELVEMPKQIMGIWIDYNGEAKIKRLKAMIIQAKKLNHDKKKNENNRT